MKLDDLLAFAMKNRAAELHLAANAPVELLADGKARGINIPPLSAADFDALVLQKLDAQAREAIRATGRCEASVEVSGLGALRILVEAGKARIVLPVKGAAQGDGAGRVPTLAERMRGLFGGKR